MTFGQLSLKGRALKYLSARDHSRAELERKLSPHEQEPGQIARVLDELQGRGFLSEARYVESVIHRRASRLGAARVRQELQARGVPAEHIAQAVQVLKASEYERAREVWAKKFGACAQDATGRARQARFLAARGFAPAVIARVVNARDDD